MNNQQVVVEKIVQNLAFEVEAVPKDKSIKAASVSQSTPLNIKIKVRKNDETQHILSGIDEPRVVQKVRLVNSDQTITTFDVFMETELEKKPQSRKHFYNILKPGICLGSDDDDYAYMPSSSYSANITEPSKITKTDGILKQTFTLSKNTNRNYNATQPAVHKWFFGKCKPGGCLDPPFSEDKYQYKPRHSSDPLPGDSSKLVQTVPIENISKDGVQDNKESNDGKSTERHSSIIDSGLLKKRKKWDKSTNTEINPNANESNSVVSLFQSDSKSLSAQSNPIITYPSNKTSHDKTTRSRGFSEDKSTKSFNENHSEPYFIPPRKNSCIKEKEILYTNPRPSDILRTREMKEPSRLPLPVSIPILIPIKSEKHDSEEGAINNSIIGDASIGNVKPFTISETFDKTGTSNELVITKLASIDIPNWNGISNQSQRKELEPGDSDNINTIQLSTADETNRIEPESDDIDGKNCTQISNISTPDQSLKIEQESEDIHNKIQTQISTNKTSSPESDKIGSFGSILSDNISMGDVNNDKIRKQADSSIDDKINGNDQINNTDTLNKTLPIPVPIPLNLGEPTQISIDKIENSNTSITDPKYKLSKDSETQILDKEPEKLLKQTNPSELEQTTIVIDSKKMLRTMNDPFDKESDYSENEDSIITAPVLPVDIGPQPSEHLTTDVSIKSEYQNNEFMGSADPAAGEKTDEQILTTTSDTSEIKISPTDKTRIIGENNQHSKEPTTDKDEIKQNLPDEIAYYLDDSNNKILCESPTANRNDEMNKYIDEGDNNDKLPPEQSLNTDHDETMKYFRNEINYENNTTDKLSLDPLMPFSSDNNDKISNQPTNEFYDEIKQYYRSEIENNKDDPSCKTLSDFPMNDYRNYETDQKLRLEIDNDAMNRKIRTLNDHEVSDISANQQQNDIVEKTIKDNNNFVTAPVLIDNVDHTLKPLKAVYSETNLIIDSNLNKKGDIIETKIASSFAEVEDMTHSLKSNEYLGVKPVLYDLHDIIPSVKYSERSPSSDKQVLLRPETIKGRADITKPLKILPAKNELKNKLSNRNNTRSTSVISSIQSTSTLKSAMKKDTIYVELGFQSYLNNKNERVFRTFDTASEPTRIPNDTVTLIKSQVRLSSNEIRIPVDSDHDVSIQLKKPYSSQRVSISESGFVNTIDNELKPNTAAQTNSGDLRNSEVKGYHSLMQSNIMDGSVMDLYEQQLVPLHLIIKNLRDEIDVLAAQQMLFRDKLYCPRKSKPPRLVHSGKRCVGCLKK